MYRLYRVISFEIVYIVRFCFAKIEYCCKKFMLFHKVLHQICTKIFAPTQSKKAPKVMVPFCELCFLSDFTIWLSFKNQLLILTYSYFSPLYIVHIILSMKICKFLVFFIYICINVIAIYYIIDTNN